MNEPQSETEESAAFEAWASDPKAVAGLEAELVAEEAADPALAEKGRRAEEAARTWLAAHVVDTAAAKLERRFPGMWDTEDGPTAYEVVIAVVAAIGKPAELRREERWDNEVRRKALLDFHDQLGRVIERTEATVTDRKVQACQAVGLRMARLVAIETADKIGREPGEEY